MISEPTVFVVDDDPDMRKSLRWLLESVDLRVETHESAQSFLEGYQPSFPECLVLDVRMPGMSGLDLQERLISNGRHIPIIIITGHGDIPMAVRALKAGALDFIEKPFNDQILLDRIQEALDYHTRTRHEEQARSGIGARLGTLTPRERDVMNGVVEGKSNKAIAQKLSLSAKTVEVHRAHVMKKMQANSLADLVRMVVLLHQGGDYRSS